MIGHGQATCMVNDTPTSVDEGELYGPWLRAEVDAFTVVKEGYYLRRVEIPRGEIFDSFQEDLNEVNTGETDSSEQWFQENLEMGKASGTTMVEEMTTYHGGKTNSGEGREVVGESTWVFEQETGATVGQSGKRIEHISNNQLNDKQVEGRYDTATKILKDPEGSLTKGSRSTLAPSDNKFNLPGPEFEISGSSNLKGPGSEDLPLNHLFSVGQYDKCLTVGQKRKPTSSARPTGKMPKTSGSLCLKEGKELRLNEQPPGFATVRNTKTPTSRRLKDRARAIDIGLATDTNKKAGKSFGGGMGDIADNLMTEEAGLTMPSVLK